MHSLHLVDSLENLFFFQRFFNKYELGQGQMFEFSLVAVVKLECQIKIVFKMNWNLKLVQFLVFLHKLFALH